MAQYNFEANQGGELVSGTIEASDRVAAYQKLSRRYDHITGLEPTSRLARLWSGRVSRTDLALWVRQMSTMLSAGIGMRRGLELGCFGESAALGRVLLVVNRDVLHGMTLSNALSKHPEVFSYQELSLFRAGEVSGKLPAVLARMADEMEGRVKLEQRLWAGMAYPLAVILFAFVLFWGFLYGVVPAMAAIFEGLKVDLPLITRILVRLSNWVRDPWLMGGLLVVLVLFILAVRRSVGLATERWRPLMYRWGRRIPLLGPLTEQLESARLLQAFSSLLAAGVRLNQILVVLKHSVDDPRRQQALEDIRQGVLEGKSLAGLFKNHRLFRPTVTHMLVAAEEAGELAQMMERAAAMQEVEIDYNTRSLIALAEPLTLFVLGIVAGTAVLSAFLPLVQLLGAFLSDM